MKTLPKIVFSTSFLTFATLANFVSADSMPGNGGVAVDMSKINIGTSVTVPTTVLRRAETLTDKNGNTLIPVKMVEAAATDDKPKADAAFKAVVDAISPHKPVAPLRGKRFTFYISEKVAFAQMERNSSKLKIENGRTHLAAIYSEKRDAVVQAGLSVDSALTSAVRLSFGSRVYLAVLNTENTDVFATALGLEAAYNLPFKKLPVEFAASFYYAPDILTFGAADRAVDAQIDIAFPLRKQSSLFVGARFLQMDVRPEDREIDNRMHMGIRWDFLK